MADPDKPISPDGDSPAPDLEDHPGRPRGDEFDPELYELPRKKAVVSPVLSACVMVLCVFLIAKLWDDVRLSMGPDKAKVFDDIDSLLKKGELGQYVAVRAVPNRAVGGLIKKSKAEEGQLVRPVFGSQYRLWVMTHASHWRAKIEHSESHAGRLRRLGDLRFFDSFKSYMRGDAGIVARRVDPNGLREAVKSKANSITAIGGDVIAMSPDTKVEVRQMVEGQLDVIGYFTPDGMVDNMAWNTSLKRAGFDIIDERAYRVSEQSAAFRIRTDLSVQALRDKLIENDLFGGRVEPVRIKHSSPWKSLKLDDASITMGESSVPWTSVESASIFEHVQVLEDAYVIVVGDGPDGYWYAVPAAGLLAAITLLFGFILFRQTWPKIKRA